MSWGVELLRRNSVVQLPSRKDDFDSDSFRQWLIRIVAIGSGRRCLLELSFLACDDVLIVIIHRFRMFTLRSAIIGRY